MHTTARRRSHAISVGLAAGLILSFFGAGIAAAAPRAFVLTNNSLLVIDAANPVAGGQTIPITGLNAGDTLVGIDVRPQNGHLYGVGFNSVAGTVTVYHISHQTGVATSVGPAVSFTTDGVTPAPVLGSNFGVDFNPTTDRLRVVTDAGQSFRLNPNDGTAIDGNGVPPGTQMDGPIGGATTTVDAAAYTNNEQNATVTTLYTLSAATNQLFIQSPPNAGTQTTPVTVTLNGSTLDFTSAGGFDIPPLVDVFSANAVVSGSGYAALTVGGVSRLYTINLTTGVALQIGTIGSGALAMQGLAIQDAGFSGPPVIGFDLNRLQRFPLQQSFSSVPVNLTGMTAGELLVGIDWRPQTGQLFGLGVDAAANTGTLYLIDPQTGSLTIIGSASSVALVASDGVTPIDLPGTPGYGFDFNPATDRIRVVTNTGLNFRTNPNTGAAVDGDAGSPGTNPDAPLNGLPGGSTGVVAAAYTNSYGQPLVGGPTTLYALDPASNKLFIQNTPNNGTMTQGVAVTMNGAPLDFFDASLDIPSSVHVETANAPATGRAYAVLVVGGTAHLYAIDLSTGEATQLGFSVFTTGNAAGFAMGDAPPPPTTTTILSSTNPALVTDTVTLTAIVLPSSATGTVAFISQSFLSLAPLPGCEARPVIAGTATCTVTMATAGLNQITAGYSGDAFNAASTSLVLLQTVNLVPTTTTLTVTPNPVAPGQTVTFTATVTPASAPGSAVFLIDDVIVGSAPWIGGRATFTTSFPTPGPYRVAAGYYGTTTLGLSVSAPVTLDVVLPGPLTQYFAEGATGFFQTDIGILNASKTLPAHVTVKLLPESGAQTVLQFLLDPLTRHTIDLDAVLGDIGGVSALVESDQPVAAMRQMTWGSPVYGSTLESGIPEPAKSWYFAEGATNTFSLFYLIENPGTTQANVTFTHLLEGGAAPVVRNEIVPPRSRRTFFINAIAGLEGASLSTVITSDVDVVAERAMYLNTTSRQWEGGTSGRGATAPSTSWSFAEGATGFFHTYLLLGNANTSETTVTVRYQLPDGTVVTKDYAVAAQSRRTVDVNFEDPQLASTAVGILLTSTLPIVAERAIWWGTPFYEGTVSIGSTETGPTWAVGEGSEGGPTNASTFVLVSNGSNTTGTVRFTVVYDDGSRQQRDYTLLGNARLTVRIADDFVLARNARFSVLVESITASMPITVGNGALSVGDDLRRRRRRGARDADSVTTT